MLMGVRGTLLLKASDLGRNMGSYRNKQLADRRLVRTQHKKEKRVAKKLGVVPLRPHRIKEIQDRLNESKFKSEEWFKKELELSGIKLQYTQNHPILKRFFADFYFEKHRLVVEIDGSSHNGKEAYDKRRDYLFQQADYKVIRIKAFNYDDLNNAFIQIKEIQRLFNEKPDYSQKKEEIIIQRRNKRNVKFLNTIIDKEYTQKNNKKKEKIINPEQRKQKSFIGYMSAYYYNNQKEINENNDKMLKAGLKK